MKRRLKEPFGKAGLTVAILALVLAMVGGAYAAGGLTKSQEKQVTKIAKKYAGKPGAAGPAGAAGANGTNGAAGKNGTNGAPGKSVVVGTATSGPSGECEEGGATVEVEGGSKKHVCNGSPWTAGGTLPSGRSEQGLFTIPNVIELAPGENQGAGAISFVIPLASAPTLAYVNPENKERVNNAGTIEFVAPQNCLGSFEHPQASKGFLCLYGDFEIPGVLAFGNANNVLAVGATFTAEGSAQRVFEGSWAVTAP